VVLILVMIFRPGGIFGGWEFSLKQLASSLSGKTKSKAVQEKEGM